MLIFEGVHKSFHDVRALNDVSFVVPTGATHALIGSSGSGKTTLLRITLGLIPLDKGYVRIDDRPLSAFSPTEWADQIGYVPQDGGLFPHFTAHENITIIARLRGWAKAKLAKRLEELKQLVDLEPGILPRFPSELSGGQQQKVAIMRAAFMNPPVLLLDEPMGALDPLVRMALQEEFRSIFKRLNKTVVIVTHDLTEAVYLADAMTLLHHGSVIQSGTYEDFYRHQVDPFVTQFIKAHRTLSDQGAE